MTKGLRLVAPYRPFPPESDLHKETADFDWVSAIRMMSHTAELSCHVPVEVITDLDTDLPVPTLKYATRHRRLMLWTLEACLRYLESKDFDRDTIMLDCDQLIYQDLRQWFTKHVDLVVLIRPSSKHTRDAFGMPILNGVQLWSRKSQRALVSFYAEALAIAEQLPEARLVWGADTDALKTLLDPLEVGLHERAGLRVRMIDAEDVIEALSAQQIAWLKDGVEFLPSRSVLDFRWRRKPYMAAAYRATIVHQPIAGVPC